VNLAKLIASETGAELDEIMLLRHTNVAANLLAQYGVTVEEYTLLQPVNSKYDFQANDRPAIEIVVAIVNDLVYAVYRIIGAPALGDTRTLAKPNYIAFDTARGYGPVPAKLFAAEALTSKATGRDAHGWTCPINPVARYGSQVFDGLEVLL